MTPAFRLGLSSLLAVVLFHAHSIAQSTALPQRAGQTRLAAELPRVPATEPADVAQTFRLLDGFQLELLAAEPLVTDPVAIKYDENGLAYVAEMGDYPYSDKSHDRPHAEQTSLPLGRIRVLEDTDGDGRFDKSTLFAEEMSWPTGLALWKGGVFVTSTPDIIYLKDIDGDRQADVRRVVYTGFRKFNVQAVINNLQWGLDHLIYGAGSSNGGEIRPGDALDADPVRIRRGDFRFDPAGKTFEAITGGARFGNTFDDWGNRFLCDIRNPVQQVVLQNRYLARNSLLSVRSALHDAAPSGGEVQVFRASPPEAWRVINSQRLASDPDSTSPNSEKVPAGFLTSSSGVTVYRGAAYPERYYGNVFVGDVAGNVALRYKLQPRGPSIAAERVYGEFEFLASTDNWFRPVNFANAPDGTLHVLDMYRETIEHPWSIPDDIKAHLDLVSGRDRGRIYRLVPARYRRGFTAPQQPRLGSASAEQLVAELANPNSWWRDTAHRLIFERQDRQCIPHLRRLLAESNSAIARLHALWSLVGLDAIDAADIARALTDSSAEVRRHAVRLAEPLLQQSTTLAQAVLDAADDPDRGVRFQTALTLGELENERATHALVRIARRDGEDNWVRLAILSSLSNSTATFLVELLSHAEFAAGGAGQAMVEQLSHAVGLGESNTSIQQVLVAAASDQLSSQPALQAVVVRALGAGLRSTGRDLVQFTSGSSKHAKLLTESLAAAHRVVIDRTAPSARRVAAIELVGYDSFDSARPTLMALLEAQQPQIIQSAVIDALAGFRHSGVADALLAEYAALTPPLRKKVVQALLARYDRLPKLVEAVAQRRVSPTLISASQRRRILSSDDQAMVELATELFAADAPSPRRQVVEKYQAALSLVPDFTRGQIVYRRECRNCHRLGADGFEVGPNLATIRHRSAADVMLHILDPNREVSPNYMEYAVVTADGRVATGTIVAETAIALTLRGAEDKEQTILRRDISEISGTGKSLMPEGLEQKISLQEMADLLAYLLGFDHP